MQESGQGGVLAVLVACPVAGWSDLGLFCWLIRRLYHTLLGYLFCCIFHAQSWRARHPRAAIAGAGL
jgi:hypothetical protein